MILYFSATGNSEYVAKYLAESLDDDIINLGDILKSKIKLEATSEKPYLVICPIYISVLPLELERLLLASTLKGSNEMYFIMTCAGSGSSAAPITAKRICKALKKTCMGVAHLSMPQNYVMYFKIASKEENDSKFNQAIESLPKLSETIKNNLPLETHQPGISHQLMASRPMVILFDKLLIGTKKFYADDTCVSCGLCEHVCPKNVIHLENGHPVWSKKGCLHCTACINHCPTKAINYGKKTKTKLRYVAKKYQKGTAEKQN